MATMGTSRQPTVRPATRPSAPPLTGPGTKQPGGPGGTGPIVFDPATPRIGANDPGVGTIGNQAPSPALPGTAVTDPSGAGSFNGVIPGLPGTAISDAHGSALLAAILGMGGQSNMLGGAAGGGPEDEMQKKNALMMALGL